MSKSIIRAYTAWWPEDDIATRKDAEEHRVTELWTAEYMKSDGFTAEEIKNGIPVVRSIKILAGGVIDEIVNCAVQGGLAWEIDIKYNTDVLDFCNGLNMESGTAWQNIADGATLADVVIGGGQLFPDEYTANQYLNNDAPSNSTLAYGYYGQGSMPANQYYVGGNTGWTTNSDVSLPNTNSIWKVEGNNKLTPNNPLKILGNGKLEVKLTVQAAAFTTSAKKKIEDVGGKCELY